KGRSQKTLQRDGHREMSEKKTRGWSEYYDVVKGSEPPCETLVAALRAYKEAPGTALDLGCGAGRDSRALLERGWRVVAIDSDPEALVRLEQILPNPLRERLTPILGRFEDVPLPRVDIVNASFSVPFCVPAKFASLWKAITAALGQGGIFCGQLFGDRDSWA